MLDAVKPETKVVAASDIQTDHEELNASISEFVGSNPEYYIRSFAKVHEATGWFPRTFNTAAALLGPIWSATRGIWGLFWSGLLLEILAWVQIGRGAWGELGGDMLRQAESQLARAEGFRQRAIEAAANGGDAARFEKLAENMTNAAERSQGLAAAAAAESTTILLTGLIFLILIRLWQGFFANNIYEHQYEDWRVRPAKTESGIKPRNAVLGVTLLVLVVPLTVIHFTLPTLIDSLGLFPKGAMDEFPADRSLYSNIATFLETQIDTAATAWSGAFDSIVAAVRWVLDVLTTGLVGTPWPVVMLVIAVVAWRSAGPRVAIFVVAAMAYLALLGFWEVSMETVALVGAAVVICVLFGIPLGIWFGKSPRAYAFSEPILDLMQTLPAFVYLIPIIAFFGTGNPPGILATIIFGMPPVIRLTALGIRGVPENIKEAAEAFGANKRQLLKDVEIPLALPSIMAGVNQTILMCLSMVVIISLIGGGGLGKSILEALQYAAKGPGLLGGFAILFCAITIDRIVQGAFSGKK